MHMYIKMFMRLRPFGFISPAVFVHSHRLHHCPGCHFSRSLRLARFSLSLLLLLLLLLCAPWLLHRLLSTVDPRLRRSCRVSMAARSLHWRRSWSSCNSDGDLSSSVDIADTSKPEAVRKRLREPYKNLRAVETPYGPLIKPIATGVSSQPDIGVDNPLA